MRRLTEDDDGRIVICYTLRKDHRRTGLAPQGCRAVFPYVFEELRAKEIWTRTRTAKKAWCSMMEKLGMSLRGYRTKAPIQCLHPVTDVHRAKTWASIRRRLSLAGNPSQAGPRSASLERFSQRLYR